MVWIIRSTDSVLCDSETGTIKSGLAVATLAPTEEQTTSVTCRRIFDLWGLPLILYQALLWREVKLVMKNFTIILTNGTRCFKLLQCSTHSIDTSLRISLRRSRISFILDALCRFASRTANAVAADRSVDC